MLGLGLGHTVDAAFVRLGVGVRVRARVVIRARARISNGFV